MASVNGYNIQVHWQLIVPLSTSAPVATLPLFVGLVAVNHAEQVCDLMSGWDSIRGYTFSTVLLNTPVLPRRPSTNSSIELFINI